MSSIANAYKLQISNLERTVNKLILENKKLKSYLSEGPIWGGDDTWEAVIRDQSIPNVQNSPQAPINWNPYSNLLNRGEMSRNPQSAYSGSGNQGGITPEQYTAHAYQVIMGIMQDAVDQGIIDSSMLSQLAGQAFATWVAGGPSALINFLNQNNIPFQQ